jgi:hypothetical protein
MAVFRACAKVPGPDDPAMRIHERGPWSGPLTGALAATLPAGPGSDGEVPAAVASGPGGTTLAIRCAISADSSSWFVDGSQMAGLLAVGWRLSLVTSPR